MANITFVENGGIEFTEALKMHARKKMKKVDGEFAVSLIKDGYNFKVQINGNFNSSAVGKDAYKLITEASEKVVAQARKLRDMQVEKIGKKGFKGAYKDSLETNLEE